MALRALGLENLSSCLGGHGDEVEVGVAVMLLLYSADAECGLVLGGQAFLRERPGASVGHKRGVENAFRPMILRYTRFV